MVPVPLKHKTYDLIRQCSDETIKTSIPYYSRFGSIESPSCSETLVQLGYLHQDFASLLQW